MTSDLVELVPWGQCYPLEQAQFTEDAVEAFIQYA